MKTLGKAIAGTVIVLLLFVAFSGVLYYSGAIYSWTQDPLFLPPNMKNLGGGATTPTCPTGQYWNVNDKLCETPSVTPGHRSAPLYVSVKNALGSQLITTATGVEVISGDKLTRLDNITMTATYTAGAGLIDEGTSFYLHVVSKAGNGYYPEWYHIVGLTDGSVVNQLVPSMTAIGQLTEVQISGSVVYYSTGSNVYWKMPLLQIYQRESAANVKFSIDSPSTSGVRTATGAAIATGNWNHTASDFSATGLQFQFSLNIRLADAAMVYGRPTILLGPSPQLNWIVTYLTVVASYNTTGIQGGYLATFTPTGSSQAWTPLPAGLTPGYKNFYTVLPAVMGTQTQQGAQGNIAIPVDTTGLTTQSKVAVGVWVADFQVPADTYQGLSDSAPTAYIPVGMYGITSTVYANGFATSSNAPVHPLDYVTFLSF